MLWGVGQLAFFGPIAKLLNRWEHVARCIVFGADDLVGVSYKQKLQKEFQRRLIPEKASSKKLERRVLTSNVPAELDVGNMNIDPEDFCQGLEVELEHGTRLDEANVTNNHPILTGKIVLAHLKESLDYYKRLDTAEIEGGVLKAVNAGKLEKIRPLYKKLAEVRLALANTDL